MNTHTHTAEWPIAKKLNYAKGKLSLIPAFGDSIGKEVNKAELGLCMAMIASAEASHADLLAALEDLLAERYVCVAAGAEEEFDDAGNWTCNSHASIQGRAVLARAKGATVTP